MSKFPFKVLRENLANTQALYALNEGKYIRHVTWDGPDYPTSYVYKHDSQVEFADGDSYGAGEDATSFVGLYLVENKDGWQEIEPIEAEVERFVDLPVTVKRQIEAVYTRLSNVETDLTALKKKLNKQPNKTNKKPTKKKVAKKR